MSVVDERLDPQALRECRSEHDSRVSDRSLVVEGHRDTVQSDRSVIVHHEGDILRRPRRRHSREKAVLRRSCFHTSRERPLQAKGGAASAPRCALGSVGQASAAVARARDARLILRAQIRFHGR